MKKALTGPDISQLVDGWQSLIGSRVDQFGRPDLNKVVLKLRSREKGTVRLLIDLSGWAYLTKTTISTESNQGVFVQKVRKLIKKSRANLLGFACIIDRSNKKNIKIKKNIVSQIKLNIPAYKKINLPSNLKNIPITKPGSRHLK